jgi:protein-arginine kinase activator protein McsA
MYAKGFDILLKRLAELDSILNTMSFENSNRVASKPMNGVEIDRVLKGTQFEDELETIKLKNEMREVIEKEDFERAAEIRDRLRFLEKNKEKLQDLRMQMKLAVRKQDFERAAEIKDKIVSLKKEGQIDDK